MVLMIGKEGMVTRARIRYKRDYLTPGMCSLNKCAVFFFNDAISRQNPHSHVIFDE